MGNEDKTPVDGEMLIAEILRKYPEAAYVLMNCGMGCIGCPSSQMESLSDACMVHGLDADEVGNRDDIRRQLGEAAQLNIKVPVYW